MVEGAKSVQELLRSDFDVIKVYGTPRFLTDLRRGNTEVIEVSEGELGAISGMETNNAAVAIARMRSNEPPRLEEKGFTLVLDDIRDPGNLGTIIRIADWYAIRHIIASPETADLYNPKVIRASMGSFIRVRLFYSKLTDFLASNRLPVFGTFLDGKNIHEVKFPEGGLIVIGNESQGITHDLRRFITDKITIPRYGEAESLNAAVATAVVCDHVRRSTDQG